MAEHYDIPMPTRDQMLNLAPFFRLTPGNIITYIILAVGLAKIFHGLGSVGVSLDQQPVPGVEQLQ